MTAQLNSLANAENNSIPKPDSVIGEGRRLSDGTIISSSELNDFRARLSRLGYQPSIGGRHWPVNDSRLPEGQAGSAWIDVTPATASIWLRDNFRNRRLREDVVMAYARDMKNGVWVPTHQGVAFNDKNELIDGQHRLHAIVASGVTVRMMVTVGLPSKIAGKEMTTMDAVDRGRPRSVADQLAIQHGIKNGSITASICAAIGSLCYGERTRRLSVQQTLDIFRAFEPAILYVIANRSRDVGLRTTGVLAGFAFAIMATASKQKEDSPPYKPALTEDNRAQIINTRLKNENQPGRELNAEFWKLPVARIFSAVTSEDGKGLKDGSPSKILREFLTSDEAKLFTRSLDRGLGELVLYAIWLELENKKIKKLEPGPEGLEYFRSLQKSRVEKIARLFRLPYRERVQKAA